MSEGVKGRVLIADDSRFFLHSLERLLEAEGYEVYTAENGHQAVEVARLRNPSLIILDIEMPQLDGIEACRKIKDIPELSPVPVLFVSSHTSSEVRLRGLRAGGEEFLTKPFVPEEILTQVEKFLKRVKSTTSLLDRLKLLETERDELQKRMAGTSPEDALANAFRVTPTNSLVVIANVDESLTAFIRDSRQFVILYLAIDNMDRVDMLYGSEVVFETQAFLFNTIVEYLRGLSINLEQVRLSRNLADDFVVFLADEALLQTKIDTSNMDDFAMDLIKQVRFSLETHFSKKEVAAILNLETGTSWVTTTARLSFNRQILNAMKDAANSAYNFQTRGRQRLHNRLREMVRTRAIKMVYQPIVRLTDLRIAAYEALTRGLYPELSQPQLMFDVAEESKQVLPLSRLCREKALEYLPKLDAGKLLFLNFHPDDFLDEQLMLGSPEEPIFAVDPKRIVIEVTERLALKDPKKLKETVDFLKKTGFRIAIDDLGSGYTSFSLIASLDPDFIKFDMSLVRGIEISSTKQALLKTLSQFTRDIGATSVAEGVETQEELDVVREFKCDLCQGFYFSKPQDHLITESEYACAASGK